MAKLSMPNPPPHPAQASITADNFPFPPSVYWIFSLLLKQITVFFGLYWRPSLQFSCLCFMFYILMPLNLTIECEEFHLVSGLLPSNGQVQRRAECRIGSYLFSNFLII